MLTSDELDDLLVVLTKAGYSTAITRRADVLTLLAARSDWFDSPRRLIAAGSMLGPVLCSTREEQAQFQAIYDAWHRRWLQRAPAPSPIEPPRLSSEVKSPAAAEKPSPWLSVLGCGALLMTLFVIAYSSGGVRMQRPVSDYQWTVADQLSTGERATRRGEGIRNSDGTGMLRLIGLIVPLVVLAFWIHWRFLCRRAVKDRYPTGQDPGVQRFVGKGDALSALFPKPSLKGLIDFRRWRQSMVHGVDLVASIDATVREGGRAVMVPAQSFEEHAYLILIDRRSANDHAARFSRVMVELLATREVRVDVYYFDEAADLVNSEHGRQQPVDLSLLIRRADVNCALVFAEADVCVGLDGSCHPWLTELSEHMPVALLVAGEVSVASREALDGLKCAVTPRTLAGLSSVPALLAAGRTLAKDRHRRWQPERFASLVALSADASIERWSAALDTLDPATRLWLAAVALYPKMSFDLTVYLGANLHDEAGRTLLSEERLGALSALSWFRQGEMPEPLRDALAQQLRRADAQQIQRLLYSVIGGTLMHEPERLADEGRRPSREVRDVVRAYLRTRADGEPMADRVMTRFMLTPQWGQRSFALPERLSRLLGFRLDAVPLLSVLMAFASMGLFGWAVDAVEQYMPWFNEWMTAHRIGVGITIYLLLVVSWSAFWTAVMLSPRYEKFTSELWRSRVRVDDPFHGNRESIVRHNPWRA